MISYEEYEKIRDAKGMTDGMVAKLAGFGRSTFTDWKSGRSFPKWEKLNKICEVLGCSKTEFLTVVLGQPVEYRSSSEEKTEAQIIAELYEKADDAIKFSIKKLLNYDDRAEWKD